VSTRSHDRVDGAIATADALEESADLPAAVAVLSRAIELDAENPKLRALRGRLQYLRKDWAAAVRDFDGALALKPNAPTTLYFRARARSMTNDLDGALQDFGRCIELQPNSADAYSEMGDIHFFRKEWHAAKAAFESAIAIEREREPHISAKLAEIATKLKEEKHRR
jgi:tetratricopeptide (TPR) repeat protein